MEVVDIVHKLSYEADTNVLEEVNKEFGVQIKQLQELKNKEAELNRQLQATATTDIRNRQKIEGLLSQNKRQYDAISISIGRQAASNDRLNRSLVQTGKNLSSLSFAGSQVLREAPAFTYSIQTGILALSNNIPILLDQLTAARKAGATTTEIFKSLGSSIFGITGLITIAVSVLTIFGDKLFNSGKEAESAADRVEGMAKSIDNLIKKSNEYNAGIEDVVGTGERAIKRELELLKARGASNDVILAKENELRAVQSKRLQEQKEAYSAALSFVIQGANATQAELDVVAQKLPSKYRTQIIEELKKAAEEGVNIEDVFVEKINQLEQELLDNTNATRSAGAADEKRRRDEEARRLEESRKDWEKVKEAIAAVSAEMRNIDSSEFEATARDLEAAAGVYEKILDKLRSTYGTDTGVINEDIRPSGRFSNSEIELGSDIGKFNRKREAEQAATDKRIQEKSKASIEESLNYTLNTTISTLQQIYDAQLYYLDAEIAARRERVDTAVELAEKGNTEILEAERTRLREAEAERERVAEKQLQLNYLLQASSAAIAATQAIQVVTNAGATGDPYTTAARIAAAVAALAAGFAFVTNLTQAARSGFKDGVIDLKGAGTETSDSIPARLSRGESVMTASETKQFKPYLEAMRAGTFYELVAQQPMVVGKGNDYGKLEKKLDGVIEAIEGNKVVAKQVMDKRGISQAIETYKKHETDRWRG